MATREDHRLIERDPERAQRLARVLKAVAHPLRLRLVAILCAAPRHVQALTEITGARQSHVSQQLGVLRAHGLVRPERVDGFAVYHLEEPRLRDLLDCLAGCGRG